MNISLLIIMITLTAINLSTSAPSDHLHQYELSMLNKLHKPWLIPDKPSEYPRKGEYPTKGEYPCKGGTCRTKPKVVNECEDCQYAKPLLVGEWEKRK